MDAEKYKYLRAARCPSTLKPQSFGLWSIEKRYPPDNEFAAAMFRLATGGYEEQTALRRITEATMHIGGECVMEDGVTELKRHLPIWLKAHGRVLVTGLGLGCVVRGLLASKHVDHIDVIEIDKDIIRIVGAEFEGNPRVTITHGDALTCEISSRWDFAWHDIWCEGSGLQILHAKLIHRFSNQTEKQGAWMLPRLIKRLTSWPLIG